MQETISLGVTKETVGKLRWSAWVEEDNAEFHLYIPKKRVPQPWPGRIFVSLEKFAGEPKEFTSDDFPGNLEEEIISIIGLVEECSRTGHYAPFGDQKSWQIGEPYIPYSLIPENSNLLKIRIVWDLESTGNFFRDPGFY